MTTKRERHIRFRAVKSGDELFYDRKWWKVVNVLSPGEKCSVGDKDRMEDAIVPDYSRRAWVLLQRGSIVKLVGERDGAVAKINRQVATA